MWYLDSGCFKHMTEEKSKLSLLILNFKGFYTYEENNKEKKYLEFLISRCAYLFHY